VHDISEGTTMWAALRAAQVATKTNFVCKAVERELKRREAKRWHASE